MGEWIEIELVEEPTRPRRVAVEPSAPKPPREPSRLEGRNRRRAAIGTGVAVLVAIVWAVTRSGDDLSTATTPSTLDESARSSVEPRDVDTTQPGPSTTTRPRATTTTGPPLVVAELGRPLLPSPSGMQLVGLTAQGDLLDIDLDTGQRTTTDIPGGASGALATIVAGANWTYVQRWDVNASFIVPRGQVPSDVSPPPELSGGAYRGPDPDTVWVPDYDPYAGGIHGLNLYRLDGEPLGRSIDVQGWYPMQSDLQGGVVVQAGGGVYVVTEAGARRVADGELVGVGVNHFLVRACDEAMACGLFVIDRQSGERRQVPVIRVDGLAQFSGWTGTDSASVSPDGTAAILFGLDGDGSNAAILGTDTGAYRTLARMTDGGLSIAWSDDSRYVAFVNTRRFQVYDRVTGDTIDLADDVPLVANFATRP
ncbi:MAG TPA: hypothetical protein VNO51_12390 [Ilumatobacteraceae bacterium]|nr:hypothetical protein [Ilumatobacteraceae bacterium]